jgi:hypothetical protein
MYNQWIYNLIFNYVHFHSFSYQKGAVYGKVDCMGEYNCCNLITLSLALVQKLVACCFSCLCHIASYRSLCMWMRMTSFKIQFYTWILWEKKRILLNLTHFVLITTIYKNSLMFQLFHLFHVWFVSLWFHISINSRGPVAEAATFLYLYHHWNHSSVYL